MKQAKNISISFYFSMFSWTSKHFFHTFPTNQSLGWKACPQSIPTVSYVSRCPADAEEWKSAAAKKDCRALGMNQSCSDDGSFAYHCVLNEEGTKLMEVCAPVWYMSGSYSTATLIIIMTVLVVYLNYMKIKFVLNWFICIFIKKFTLEKLF